MVVAHTVRPSALVAMARVTARLRWVGTPDEQARHGHLRQPRNLANEMSVAAAVAVAVVAREPCTHARTDTKMALPARYPPDEIPAIVVGRRDDPNSHPKILLLNEDLEKRLEKRVSSERFTDFVPAQQVDNHRHIYKEGVQSAQGREEGSTASSRDICLPGHLSAAAAAAESDFRCHRAPSDQITKLTNDLLFPDKTPPPPLPPPPHTELQV